MCKQKLFQNCILRPPPVSPAADSQALPWTQDRLWRAFYHFWMDTNFGFRVPAFALQAPARQARFTDYKTSSWFWTASNFCSSCRTWSGIQKSKTVILLWIPDQARNDKLVVRIYLSISLQKISTWIFWYFLSLKNHPTIPWNATKWYYTKITVSAVQFNFSFWSPLSALTVCSFRTLETASYPVKILKLLAFSAPQSWAAAD